MKDETAIVLAVTTAVAAIASIPLFSILNELSKK